MPTYNKLVRDRIPEIIMNQGKSLNTRVLESAEYLSELRTKLQEETDEYLAAQTDRERIEELADMLELLRALAVVHGATPQQLEKVRSEKAEQRGGFKERIYLVEVQDA